MQVILIGTGLRLYYHRGVGHDLINLYYSVNSYLQPALLFNRSCLVQTNRGAYFVESQLFSGPLTQTFGLSLLMLTVLASNFL